MSANEKFDTAMVFETQLDEAGLQSEQKKISQLMQQKMDNVPDEEDLTQSTTLELDQVNAHLCMKNLKRVFDKMNELFHKEWEESNL